MTIPVCIALRNYDLNALHRHRLPKYRHNMVSSGYIRLEEVCFLEDCGVGDYSCRLMADIICGDLPGLQEEEQLPKAV